MGVSKMRHRRWTGWSLARGHCLNKRGTHERTGRDGLRIGGLIRRRQTPCLLKLCLGVMNTAKLRLTVAPGVGDRVFQQGQMVDFPDFQGENTDWPLGFGKDEQIGRLSAIEQCS